MKDISDTIKIFGWVLFNFLFIETKISTDCHTSIHQKRASWWIVCVKFLQKFQFLILTKGEIYWIINWFWKSPKQCPHKKQSTDENGKWNLFLFVVRWYLMRTGQQGRHKILILCAVLFGLCAYFLQFEM